MAWPLLFCGTPAPALPGHLTSTLQLQAKAALLGTADAAPKHNNAVFRVASTDSQHLTPACHNPINSYIKSRINWSAPLITTENQEYLRASKHSMAHNTNTSPTPTCTQMMIEIRCEDCFLFSRVFPYKLSTNSVSMWQEWRNFVF